jgi:hypothetical protein
MADTHFKLEKTPSGYWTIQEYARGGVKKDYKPASTSDTALKRYVRMLLRRSKRLRHLVTQTPRVSS